MTDSELCQARGVYHVTCTDCDGNIRWRDVAENVVPTLGANAVLDAYFAGSGYTAALYLSLITAGTATATSTYAAPTVTEVTSGVLAARQAMGWTAASARSKSSTNTACAMVGSATITGLMVVSGGSGVATIGNTAAAGGVLLSAGAFSGGSKTVSNGDTLNCSYAFAI